MQPNKIAHFDELNTWTQSGTERMVRKDDWKLVLDNYGRGELYNLKADPSEINNLYNKEICFQTNGIAGRIDDLGTACTRPIAGAKKSLSF